MPFIDSIRAAHLFADRQAVLPLWNQAGSDAEEVLRLLEEKHRQRDTVSFLTIGQDLALAAARLSRAQESSEDERADFGAFAVNLADFVHRRYFLSPGTFVEYDRCSWLSDAQMWRTIPWGIAFRGQQMLNFYEQLGDDLPPVSRAWWRESLEKMGVWMAGNPVAGSFVFNCSMDLCHLLWRLGRALERPDWTQWAMEAAHERIRRDVDEDGWIAGENGGVSGMYHLVGTRFLSRFAWDSDDEVLNATLLRISGNMMQWVTPTAMWAGNFGTRSTTLERLGRVSMLVAAARGNAASAHFVRRYGEPAWSHDLDLWRAALEAPAQAPTFAPVTRFEGIESVRVQQGPFVAYFCNYGRSLWARGFCNLWHAAHDEMIFSTLHSLPTQVEKSKLHLGDTGDWAGFPHVRVEGDGATYDSQRRMENLRVEEENGVTVSWDEPLCDAQEKQGGAMHSTYRFEGETLRMRVRLSEVAGRCTLDFHILKRKSSFLGLWHGDAVKQIEAGSLPVHGGWHHDRVYDQGAPDAVGVQLDNTVWKFEFHELPQGALVSLGHLKDDGLHTGNQGGARLHIEIPESQPELLLELSFRCIHWPIAAAEVRS